MYCADLEQRKVSGRNVKFMIKVLKNIFLFGS